MGLWDVVAWVLGWGCGIRVCGFWGRLVRCGCGFHQWGCGRWVWCCWVEVVGYELGVGRRCGRMWLWGFLSGVVGDGRVLIGVGLWGVGVGSLGCGGAIWVWSLGWGSGVWL